jgi:hypothetical protein
MKPFRYPLTAIAFVIALAFAFVLAEPVFAQDELPPAPDEPAVVETVPAAEEAAPAEEPLPVEEPPAAPVEEPLPVEEPAAVVVEEAAPPVEEPAVEAAPEIVALDVGGAVLPLVTQEAAEVMAEPDPWFACTIDDVDGLVDGKCSYTGGNALNIALGAFNAKGGSGPIYIEATTHSVTANVNINGAVLTNLTGVMAVTGGSSANVNLNLGTFYMNITGTTKGFTLQGLNIYGDNANPLVLINLNSGNLTLTDLVIKNSNTNGDGLQVSNQTGNVTLNTVKSDQNGDEGANIYAVSGNVVVTNSSFDSNGQGGASTLKRSLYIQAAGTITLNGVSSSNFNRGDGAYLVSGKGITVKNSLFNGNSDSGGANNSSGLGLYIYRDNKGSVILDHVYANSNTGELGIRIETNTGGAVTLKTVEARNNRAGIWIDNCWDLGLGCTTTSGAVSLTNLDLYNNYGNLSVIANGAITGTTITATYANNAASFGGLILDNSIAKSVSAVTLSNVDNSYSQLVGLKIRSKGAITLNHVTSSNNYWAGVNGIDIQTNGAVTINSTLGSNNSQGNGGYGTTITTTGAVTISKLDSTGNTGTNLYIYNSGGTGAVKVTGGNFYESHVSGIVVISKGAITITDTSASGNWTDGINLDNHTAGSAQPVTVKSTVSGIAFDLSGNDGYGLKINSKGNITLAGLNINQSPGDFSQVYIDNTAGSGTVNLSNSSFRYIDDPLNIGAVVIYSHGAVTISGTKVTYSNTLDKGLVVDNCIDLGLGCTTSGTPGVTITGLVAENNTLAAVDITSKGAVKLTNTTAQNNKAGGEAAIKITTKGSAGSVTLDTTTGNYNYIYNNLTNGLWIDSGGAVTIKMARIYNNSAGYGLRISKSSSVAISDTSVYSNPSYGINVVSSGAINLAGVNIYSNGLNYGAYLDNCIDLGGGCTTSGTPGVTISGTAFSGSSNISSNPAYNLQILTHGALKLSSLTVEYSDTGIVIPLTVGDVTLNNVTTKNGSGGDSLNIVSNGSVTASNVYTYSTSGSGLVIVNTAASSKPVTITNFSDDSAVNGTYALFVQSKGAISLTDFHMNGNGTRDFGIWLDNTASDARAPVTVKKSPSNWNNYVQRFDGTALSILSDGLVTVDGIYFQQNENGVNINSSQGGVALTNATIQSGNNGVNIIAGGAITLTNVNANNNDGNAVVLDNASVVGAAVTILNLNAYGENGMGTGTGGLEIDSQGAVTITNLNAGEQESSGYGLDISTTGAVTIKTTGSIRNDIINNAGSGGVISAGGNVSISMLNADNSVTGSGFSITTSGGSVTIADSSFSNNNTFGLSVTITAGSGAITLTNIDSSGNDTIGAALDNHLGTGGITINGKVGDWNYINGSGTQNIILNTRGAITMNYVEAGGAPEGLVFPSLGTQVGNVTMNYVNINGITASYGIQFDSNGTVSLSHIGADNISGNAIYIENWNTGTPKNVTLLDINSSGGTGVYGLYVRSKGTIGIKDLTLGNDYMTDNRTYGAWLDNTDSTAAAGISLGLASSNTNEIYDFSSFGLHILSDGPVSVSDTQVYRASYGVWVDNQAGGSGTGSVTLTRIYAGDNDFDGVRIRTNGNTALTNVQSGVNGNTSGMGVDIMVGETPAHYSGTVTLTNISANSNNDDEVRVYALRQVTIKNLDAYDYSFNGIGAFISTDGGVSFLDPGGTDWNYIYQNDDGNVVINALGDVILQKMLVDSSSAGSGVEVMTNGKVTVNSLQASSNAEYGFYVETDGVISVSGLDIQSNTSIGAYLINTSGTTAGVTVTGSTFYSNNGAEPYGGLVIRSNGAVLLNQITSTGNSGYGAYITNNSASATITVNKSTFSENYSDGLYVIGRGNITINGITAHHNNSSHNGVFLDNSAGTGTIAVLSTLGANTFNENTFYGLRIASKGAVTINSVTANFNTTTGIKVDNHLAVVAGTGTVTVTNAVVQHNAGGNGLEVDSNGAVTLTSIQAVTNGVSSNSAGIDLDTGGNYNALVQNSVVSGNGWNGIRADVGSATLTVKKTYYMGNNRSSPGDADPNIFIAAGGHLSILY